MSWLSRLRDRILNIVGSDAAPQAKKLVSEAKAQVIVPSLDAAKMLPPLQILQGAPYKKTGEPRLNSSSTLQNSQQARQQPIQPVPDLQRIKNIPMPPAVAIILPEMAQQNPLIASSVYGQAMSYKTSNKSSAATSSKSLSERAEEGIQKAREGYLDREGLSSAKQAAQEAQDRNIANLANQGRRAHPVNVSHGESGDRAFARHVENQKQARIARNDPQPKAPKVQIEGLKRAVLADLNNSESLSRDDIKAEQKASRKEIEQAMRMVLLQKTEQPSDANGLVNASAAINKLLNREAFSDNKPSKFALPEKNSDNEQTLDSPRANKPK